MDKTTDQPEPERGTMLETTVGIVALLLLMALIIPTIAQFLSSLVWEIFTINDVVRRFFVTKLKIEGVSLWIGFGLIGITAAIIIIEKTFKQDTSFFRVTQGFVQFIRCDVPGLEWVLKLEGGWHFPPIPFLFSKWNEAWEIDQRWQINTDCYEPDPKDPDNEKKQKRKRLNISVGGQEYEFSAVATVRPDRDNLLPLHVLSNEVKDRRKLAVQNLESALKRSIEQVVTSSQLIIRKVDVDGKMVDSILGIAYVLPGDPNEIVRIVDANKDEKWRPYAPQQGDFYRGFKSLEEIAAQGENLSFLIHEEFGSQAIIGQYGLVLDTLSLGEIDYPEKVAERRQHAAGMQTMMDQVKKTRAEGQLDDSVTDKDLLQVQQLAAKDISQSSTTSKSGWDKETLEGLKGLVEVLGKIIAQFRNQPGTN